MYDTTTVWDGYLEEVNHTSQIPSLTAIITTEDVKKSLEKVFTHPLCEVIKTNREGILKILKWKLEKIYTHISSDSISDFLESDRWNTLLEREIERERQEKIEYWKAYLESVESWEAIKKSKSMGISLSQKELEKIGHKQLVLLWIPTNRDISSDNSFDFAGI